MQAPLPVVTSFSILQDLVQQVGADRVTVQSLVPAGGDTHVFQPGPAQVRQLGQARLVVINGLGFEGWMPRLVGSSGYKGTLVEAARGVSALQAVEHGHGAAHAEEPPAHGHEEAHGAGAAHTHADAHGHGKAHGHDDDAHAAGQAASPGIRKGQPGETGGAAHAHDHDHHHGELDPHAWQDVQNVRRYVANILHALCAAAPADCPGFRQRAGAYDKQLQQLDRDIRNAIGAVPAERRRVMVSHAAFGYYAKAYGVEFMAPVGVSTEAEPSAAIVGRLIRQARQQAVKAFFFENNSDPRLLRRMAAELKDIRLGELYSDALSPADGPAADYIGMMRYNTRRITEALK